MKAFLLYLWDGLVGCPVGSKICVHLRNNNICSKEECERLLSFTNNSGPIFILGSVGIGLFGSSCIGVLLLLSHILGSISVGFLFKFWKKNSYTKNNFTNTSIYDNKLQEININNLGKLLSESISSATSTILMIGGFVVLFSVLISILNSSGILSILQLLFNPICNKLNIPNSISYALLNGILEITNGINLISSIKLKAISINLILASFILGFGGICILLQVTSILAKSDLSIMPYIIGKILHGCFSAFYTFILIQIFPFFNFNL